MEGVVLASVQTGNQPLVPAAVAAETSLGDVREFDCHQLVRVQVSTSDYRAFESAADLEAAKHTACQYSTFQTCLGNL